MQVMKRDGSLETFMPEKVVVSIVKSGVPYEEARSIADSLSRRTDSKLDSSTIREQIHSELRSRGFSSAIEHWNSYDETRRHAS